MDPLDTLTDVLGTTHPSSSDISYLASLTDLPLPDLLAEPASLSSTSAQLTNALTTLCHTQYPTFLSLHSASTSLSSTLTSLQSSLGSLLTALPTLQSSAQSFSAQTAPLLKQRQQALLVKAHSERLGALLDLPRLFEASARAGALGDALDISSYTDSLARKFPDVPLVQDIHAEVNAAQRSLLAQLLESLSAPGRGRLPQLFKSVGFLRRMKVLEEEELAQAFLNGRTGVLESSLHAIELTEDADGHSRYMKKYVDTWREGVHDLVTQYTTIFLSPSSSHSVLSTAPHSPSSAKAHTPSLAPASDLETTLTLQALLSATSTRLLNHLLAKLRQHVSAIRAKDPAALSALLTQMTYCAGAFARIGMDFGLLIAPIFVDAVRNGFKEELDDAAEALSSRFRQAKDAKWLITPSMAGQPPEPDVEAIKSSPTHVVPQILASFPPLALFTNSILTALNGLRLLAPVQLLLFSSQSLDDALNSVSLVFLSWLKGSAWDEQDSKIVRAAGQAYARVLVPWTRRALVKGVFDATKPLKMSGGLAETTQKWEMWLGDEDEDEEEGDDENDDQ
ncbi:Dor1-domain-containing protein [Punctularia strigosozonata HHB-11173 SS5]|uniref:Dor1-domain-containing protein n=1 Tax=Punctularia strigosozonata (strain HHB-11173) TaxID=741275 RepID=UPI00044173F9|nr:Dor1-domain-containing protein [Punctularia strigosozonata HHB-11173 SS5]EIN14257.1 Dor1-domain-containing protein [Punctularia strigosozonata HHB-11173 SS5]